MSSGSRPAGPALGHDSVRGGGRRPGRAVRNGALGHPAVIWAGDTVAANNATIMTSYLAGEPRQVQLIGHRDGLRRVNHLLDCKLRCVGCTRVGVSGPGGAAFAVRGLGVCSARDGRSRLQPGS